MQTTNNKEIIIKISEYENYIDIYWSSLNKEGVWLFLATLGCWSVSHIFIQTYAIMITFILFSYRIYSKFNDITPLYSMRRSLEEKIKNELEESDTKKARLHDLYKIKDKKLSTLNTLKSTFIFLICYSFLIITFYFNISHQH
jgi:hypothetical protein